ncbi:MAG: transposase [Patescibacteria group bacterium]
MFNHLSLSNKVDFLSTILSSLAETSNLPDSHYHSLMGNTEVLIIAVISCLDFQSNHAKTLAIIKDSKVFDYVLSPSQFCRRVNRLQEFIPLIVNQISVAMLALVDKMQKLILYLNYINVYITDTYPVNIVGSMRITSCKLVMNHKSKEKILSKKTQRLRKVIDEDYRGFCASKNQWYYGFKFSPITNCLGLITNYLFNPAKTYDPNCLLGTDLNLPSNSQILADSIYDNDLLIQSLRTESIELTSVLKVRKLHTIESKNVNYENRTYIKYARRAIETTFSSFDYLIPKKFNSKKLDGLILKLHISVLAYNLQKTYDLINS